MAAAAKTTIVKDKFLDDDNSILNAINPTHTHDGRITAIKPLLSVAAKILKETGITTLVQEILLEDNIKTIEPLTSTIHTVSCKLACECSGVDQHGGAMRIFKLLGCYDWDAKVMIALTAFAMNYGELYLLSTAKTSLSGTLAALKRPPRITENIQVLIQAVTKLSKCITDVTCYPDHISSDDSLVLLECKFAFPIAAYWIIRSLVACSSHFTSFTDEPNNGSFTVDSVYISFLVEGIDNLYNRINALLEKIAYRKYQESYLKITILFEMVQKTTLQILEGIHNSEDLKPLVHGEKGSVTLEEVLTKKTVMLYVSDLSIITKAEELAMLKARYMSQSHQQHEIVWLPIIDDYTADMKKTFYDLVTDMPWYALNPVCLKREAKQYIKEKWMHEKKTSLVVLDQGKVVCHDALHQVRIWKKLDFSFTVEESYSLWRNVSWKLDLFEDHFDAATKEWVRKNNNICLYGGKDLKWIKEFTTEFKRVSEITKTQVKIVYIGKHVKEVMNQAKVAKYNVDCWDEAKIRSFWEHVESMWHCKMQHQSNTSNNDVILQELMRMISFGNSEEGWAIFSKGATSNIVKAHEKELLTCLREWKTSKEEFFVELSKKFSNNKTLPTDHHCISFVLPRDAANFKEEMLCAQCQKPMEKFVLYRCCK
ncbi:protein SIEVE ELEMENT OCCLUSION B-like isoform X1 [Zingiber officinale]|uniref:Protein SIEVE ELEMENT OCCLUSION B-like n=2 Tax=Zingiber officinale TaxID=94328 RepID=A0A8J5IDV1_ZINOF|nr:protein SIEVE ELEMENT OCCLUSION B-like isoform X1 [Zingiber officinale]XP_042374694.1 protein SIEVE ELEMENT OCCLUSION B-like isoform X1 [Zingiber officinale]XP_042374701.1 protein SIEVE ELEMENT OCCLUSION B-like isoform X1 [Zingiber officinale]KAG6532324.1 hypothetical protein ZIOFF_006164 [Zingiber officinale]